MKDNYPINIVEEIWTYLSPFSAHQINIWDKNFPTVEHAYQWAKFSDEKIQEEIFKSTSPKAAWTVAQKYKKEFLNPNFDKDKIMEELFRAKVEQHEDVREVLMLTGERGILKIHPEDFYWGTGSDGTGQNKMGNLWQKIREEIKNNL